MRLSLASHSKCDKFGRPVYIELVGKIDFIKMLQVTTEKRLIDYHVFTWERFHRQLMPACSQLTGKPIITASVILDLAGLGIMSFSLVAQRLLSALAHIDQVMGAWHSGRGVRDNLAARGVGVWCRSQGVGCTDGTDGQSRRTIAGDQRTCFPVLLLAHTWLPACINAGLLP